MSYSTKRPQRNQIMYNKWRMGSVFLNVIGLMLFMFGIGFEENRLLYMVGSVIILWLAFAVTYIYFNRNKGTPPGSSGPYFLRDQLIPGSYHHRLSADQRPTMA